MTAIAACLIVASAENTHAGLLTSASEAQLEAWLGGGDRVFTNIYTKASGHTAVDFHAAADGKGPTISLMQIASIEGSASDPDVGQIIGGYNPQSWNSDQIWHYSPTDSERTAFIFNLSSGVRLEQRTGTSSGGPLGIYQTYNSSTYGPTFGGGTDLITSHGLSYGRIRQYSYGDPTDGRGSGFDGRNLLGDSYHSHRPGADSGYTEVTFGQIEVFTFSDVQANSNMVPEPASLAIFGVMGLAGCLRRRRVD